MARWNVVATPDFAAWWNDLALDEQESVMATVGMLKDLGPHLGFPHSSAIRGRRLSRLRELRIQHEGRPWRVLYAFDPHRSAVLLTGGDKTGDDCWYRQAIPRAEWSYRQHLDDL